MIFLIGGSCQGKLQHAMQSFGLTDADVFTCAGPEIDFSRRCIDHVELLALHRSDPVEYLEQNRALWHDSVLIMEDIFCGVVPMGAENRAWRQRAGRLSQHLSREARQVSRIFCGLELRLK